MVGNLLNMSRIEAGALKLQCQWNSLAEIVDTSIRRLRRSTAQRVIDVEVSEDLPLVYVDQVLMEQVFINLIGNSHQVFALWNPNPSRSEHRRQGHADIGQQPGSLHSA